VVEHEPKTEEEPGECLAGVTRVSRSEGIEQLAHLADNLGHRAFGTGLNCTHGIYKTLIRTVQSLDLEVRYEFSRGLPAGFR
jgi:hypothetical protein